MKKKKKTTKRPTTRAKSPATRASKAPAKAYDAAAVMAMLNRSASRKVRDGMARFAIPSDNALGVAVGDIRKIAKQIGRNHALTTELWATGCYEARLLCAFIGDPQSITPAQMDRWTADFDNWAVCDTLCFHLFDKTPHAFGRIKKWATSRDEFVKRAAFALLASLGGHDRTTGDAPFIACLPLIERAATDDRNFVKKGVSWALRSIGRRSTTLYAASKDLAARLAESDESAPRWIGKDALRDLSKAKPRKP